jgi:hypothetical protein
MVPEMDRKMFGKRSGLRRSKTVFHEIRCLLEASTEKEQMNNSVPVKFASTIGLNNSSMKEKYMAALGENREPN